jgi:hypothetical protein
MARGVQWRGIMTPSGIPVSAHADDLWRVAGRWAGFGAIALAVIVGEALVRIDEAVSTRWNVEAVR